MTEVAIPDELRLFFEHSPVALALAETSGDTPLALVNHSFRELTGYSTEDVIGRNCRLLQADAKNTGPRETLRAFLAKPEMPSVRTTILNFRKDGTPFVNLLFMSRLRGMAGETRYFFASQFDVSRSQPERLREYDAELGNTLTRLSPLAAQSGLIIEGSLTTIANSANTIAHAKLALADLQNSAFF